MLEVPKFTLGCAVILSVLFQMTNRTTLNQFDLYSKFAFALCALQFVVEYRTIWFTPKPGANA
jgi:hypothetical protein